MTTYFYKPPKWMLERQDAITKPNVNPECIQERELKRHTEEKKTTDGIKPNDKVCLLLK